MLRPKLQNTHCTHQCHSGGHRRHHQSMHWVLPAKTIRSWLAYMHPYKHTFMYTCRTLKAGLARTIYDKWHGLAWVNTLYIYTNTDIPYTVSMCLRFWPTHAHKHTYIHTHTYTHTHTHTHTHARTHTRTRTRTRTRTHTHTHTHTHSPFCNEVASHAQGPHS